MKILLDPILTSSPGQCSTTVQYWAIVNYLLFEQKRDDLFFYWLVPEWVTADEFEFYPKHPSVQYLFVPQHKDRTKEYVTLSKEVDGIMAFNGSHWDWDLMITTRSGLAQLYRLLSCSPRTCADHRLKKIWIIEEMPLMGFKKTVPQLGSRTPDLYTLAGYLAADKVFVTLCHERKEILATAMKELGTSKVKELSQKLVEFVPATLKTFELKQATQKFKKGSQPFGFVYVGRMDKTSSRLDEINELMVTGNTKYLDQFDPFVCTVSKAFKSFDRKEVDVKNYKRADFWDAMRNRAHLGVMLHQEAGFSLSLLEPMCFGVPFLVTRRPWSEAVLGPNYPFYANNKSECWAWMQEWFDNYDQHYEVFQKWMEEEFIPRMQGLFSTHLLVTMVEDALAKLDFNADYHANHSPEAKGDMVVKSLVDIIKYQDEIVLNDELTKLCGLGTLTAMKSKLGDNLRDDFGLVWSPVFNDIRMNLKANYGWVDASTQIGHLKKPLDKPVA